MNDDGPFFFVYGIFRDGHRENIFRKSYFMEQVSEAILPGHLVAMRGDGEFRDIALAVEKEGGRIVGDVVKINPPDKLTAESLIYELDVLEHGYRRTRKMVILPGGEELLCWVYLDDWLIRKFGTSRLTFLEDWMNWKTTQVRWG